MLGTRAHLRRPHSLRYPHLLPHWKNMGLCVSLHVWSIVKAQLSTPPGSSLKQLVYSKALHNCSALPASSCAFSSLTSISDTSVQVHCQVLWVGIYLLFSEYIPFPHPSCSSSRAWLKGHLLRKKQPSASRQNQDMAPREVFLTSCIVPYNCRLLLSTIEAHTW